MPVLRPRGTVVGLEGEVIVHRQTLRVVVGERVPSTPRQTLILRRCNGKLIEVLRPDGSVVRHDEVAEPATVVPDFNRSTRENFVLDRSPELPVVRPDPPALKNRRVDRHGRHRVSERRTQPGSALTVCGGIHEIAVRHVVEVGVIPITRRGGLEAGALGRIHEGIPILVVRALQVLADVHLQRRLPSAEHVVRRAHARRDVIETFHTLGARECDGLRMEAVGPVPSVVLGGRPAPGAVEACGPLQRQPPHRPLVLRIHGVVFGPIGGLPVADVHRQLVGHAIVEPIGHTVFVPEFARVGYVIGALIAELHVVRPCHVRG